MRLWVGGSLPYFESFLKYLSMFLTDFVFMPPLWLCLIFLFLARLFQSYLSLIVSLSFVILMLMVAVSLAIPVPEGGGANMAGVWLFLGLPLVPFVVAFLYFVFPVEVRKKIYKPIFYFLVMASFLLLLLPISGGAYRFIQEAETEEDFQISFFLAGLMQSEADYYRLMLKPNLPERYLTEYIEKESDQNGLHYLMYYRHLDRQHLEQISKKQCCPTAAMEALTRLKNLDLPKPE